MTIRNFGPIKDMTLDLRHVNILIGDQGTGKSTVAKVLTAIKITLNVTFLMDSPKHFLMAEGLPATEKDFKSNWKNDFLQYINWTGLANSLYADSYISFKNEEYSFLYETGEIDIRWREVEFDIMRTPVHMYIPANREVAMVLKDKLFAVLQAKATLPDILTRFGTGFLEARTKKPQYDYQNVFGIGYRHSDGMDYVILNDGRVISIEDASSALRTGVPMLVVFDNVLNTDVLYCPYLVVEEPELNCFPETQEKLMKYFVEHLKKADKYNNRLLITTHSPYILTTLNNLMYAFVAGKAAPEATNNVVESKYWLNPEDVTAYMLHSNGTCEDIFDRKEALIDTAKIDSISKKLNKEFDALIDIELNVTNEKH